MSYRSLREAVNDLEKTGQLIRISQEVDPDLEMAAIHRRVYDAKGPAIYFERVKGSPFPAVSNLYGTFERTDFLFRHSIEKVKKVIELKADPARFLAEPFRYLSAPLTALSALPRRQRFGSPIRFGETTISQLPQIKSWPMDGGAFVTLPQVLTFPPGERNPMQSNIGMYRIQLSGNDYIADQEVGLHYQLHRGIGVHHTQYNESDLPFRASVFVGGPPSHSFAAIMPLPEGLSELTFAGLLGGRRFRYIWEDDYFLSGDADFTITGTIEKNIKKPEGPFGDHLGYYSLTHDFPVMKVHKVFHRKDAIWHFTVVGRPPQEDSSFGYLIHELVKPLTAGEFPGIKEINAVDAAGVHPLLLAVGSERYMPFRERQPEEILAQANRILGSGQTSLAKYLFIAATGDGPVSANDIAGFFKHTLERVDWTRDLHFQTKTTIDTLDYSGSGWNAGSKVVIACCGKKIRTLGTSIPADLTLPKGFHSPTVVLPGILAIQGSKYDTATLSNEIDQLTKQLQAILVDQFPLLILCDDAKFTAESINNFVWVAFTRSNPSHDIYGIDAFVEHKHWGCNGSVVIDARTKPHHAPGLVTDPTVEKRVDHFFTKGAVLGDWG